MSKALMRKTLELSSSTLVSRVFGFMRDWLMPRYLGVGAVADVFVTAFRLPNSLRKIFAEGALSAACVPVFVRIVKEQGQEAASKLISSLFLIVEGFVLLFCWFIACYAQQIVYLFAPGWQDDQIILGVSLLKIFIFFIFFTSSSALLACALQAVHHFLVPACGQIILNIMVVAGIILCINYNLSVATFAWMHVAGGLVMFLMHVAAYYRHNFRFMLRDIATQKEVRDILRKFVPSILSIGFIEVNFWVSSSFASYLSSGSIALFTYASNFMRLPLGVLIVPFANIIFPQFARVTVYAPKRLSYYLLEAAKLLFWTMIPIMLLMCFFAHDIFATLYLSEKFTMQDVIQAQWILILMLFGIFFFAINKIIVNVFYALHNTFLPSCIMFCGSAANTVLDILLMKSMGIYGLALAQTIAVALQTVLFFVCVRRYMQVTLYGARFGQFVLRSLAQLSCISLLFYGLFTLLRALFAQLPGYWAIFFTQKIGLWLWVGPLCVLMLLLMWLTNKRFGIKMHFLTL